MSKHVIRMLTAVCGVVGTVVLIGSFVINPAPPASDTIAQLRDFGLQHYDTIVLGGWLQALGSLLTVVFALALVHLAGAKDHFAGWLTLLAGITVLVVSLVEVVFYLAAVQAGINGDLTTMTVSLAIIKAVQHVFLLGPALLLPLGAVLIGTRLLPRLLGYTALAIGATLQVLGVAGLFNVLQPVIDVLLMVQGLWFIVAALTLAVRTPKSEIAPSTPEPRTISIAGHTTV